MARNLANVDIRQAIKEAGLTQWEVAEHLNICEVHFSRKLRKELPLDEKEKIFKIIQENRQN